MSDTPRQSPIAWYAVAGVVLILTTAIVRLTPYAVEALEGGLTLPQWAAMLAFAVFMLYSEGYRGFQLRFSPRVVVRALHFGAAQPSVLTPLAPLVAMGLLHGTKRLLIANWALTAMIVTFVLLLRITPQPWRGIVDAGVVLGLVYGTAAILAFWYRALTGNPPAIDPELPARPAPER